jgi:crossover junction endodeoxyribonuclease RuvC
MVRVVAIDPSLRSTGFAYTHYRRRAINFDIVTGTIPTDKLRGVPRLEHVVDKIQSLIDNVRPELMVMEGYAMGAPRGKGGNNNSFSIGELGGVLKFAIYKSRIPLLLVPPTSLKLFATGKGNANKEVVMEAISKHSGRVFSSDDEADAYGLLQMGLMTLELNSSTKATESHLIRALQGCEIVAAG